MGTSDRKLNEAHNNPKLQTLNLKRRPKHSVRFVVATHLHEIADEDFSEPVASK